jgi:hypothetical protein
MTWRCVALRRDASFVSMTMIPDALSPAHPFTRSPAHPFAISRTSSSVSGAGKTSG